MCQSFHFVTLILHPLHNCVQSINRFVVLFSWGWWYAINILYCCVLPPFPFCCYRSSLFSVSSVEERFKYFPCIEIGGLSAPISNVLFKSSCLRQKGDPFRHHNCVGNLLPSCSFKPQPFLGWSMRRARGFYRVVRPHYIECVFLEVDFVKLPIGIEQIL